MTVWTLPELDILHAAVGLGPDWQRSTARAEYLDPANVVARNREAAQDHLDAALRTLCTRLGLPPWETCIRPRLHADADAVAALMARVRADALAAQGKPARDGRGRFVGRGR